jgi:hypothetical protein
MPYCKGCGDWYDYETVDGLCDECYYEDDDDDDEWDYEWDDEDEEED